jgi:two-component system, sensor histidine kinase and response regulator
MTGPEIAQRSERDPGQAEIDRLQAENARLSGELMDSARLNELFASTLGHDLRNPLGAMLMSATILSRKVEDESLRRAIGRILTAGNRMNHMISELLDFARARDPSGLRMECARIDVASLFRQAADEISDGGNGRPLTFESRGDTMGRWDPNRLAQVASNLLDGAARLGTPDGELDVKIDGADPVRVAIEVGSPGTIPADLMPVVFDPFQGGVLHNRRAGSGLGLFIAREIVTAHGGTVGVVSQGDRLTFSVSLPRGS